MHIHVYIVNSLTQCIHKTICTYICIRSEVKDNYYVIIATSPAVSLGQSLNRVTLKPSPTNAAFSVGSPFPVLQQVGHLQQQIIETGRTVPQLPVLAAV